MALSRQKREEEQEAEAEAEAVRAAAERRQEDRAEEKTRRECRASTAAFNRMLAESAAARAKANAAVEKKQSFSLFGTLRRGRRRQRPASPPPAPPLLSPFPSAPTRRCSHHRRGGARAGDGGYADRRRRRRGPVGPPLPSHGSMPPAPPRGLWLHEARGNRRRQMESFDPLAPRQKTPQTLPPSSGLGPRGAAASGRPDQRWLMVQTFRGAARLDAAGLGCGPGDSMYRAAAARPSRCPCVRWLRRGQQRHRRRQRRCAPRSRALTTSARLAGAAAVRKAPPAGARPVSTTGANPLRHARKNGARAALLGVRC